MTAPTTAVDDVDNATRLRTATKRRSDKGGWLIALVLLLAALAAGAGWWFGSGPGSQVAVADVASRSFAEAQQILAEQSLPGRPEGRVRPRRRARRRRRHRSAGGLAARQGRRRSTVLVSQGPQPQDVQALAGLTAADARGILQAINLQVAEPDQEFFTDAAGGHGRRRRGRPARGRRRRWTARRAAPRSRATPRRCRCRSGPCPTCAARASSRRRAILADSGLVGRRHARGVPATTSTPVRSSTSPSARAAAAGSPGDIVTLVVSSGPAAVPGARHRRADPRSGQGGARPTPASSTSTPTLWDAVLDEITEVGVAGARRRRREHRQGHRRLDSASTARRCLMPAGTGARLSACRAPRPPGTRARGSACGSGAGRTGDS